MKSKKNTSGLYKKTTPVKSHTVKPKPGKKTIYQPPAKTPTPKTQKTSLLKAKPVIPQKGTNKKAIASQDSIEQPVQNTNNSPQTANQESLKLLKPDQSLQLANKKDTIQNETVADSITGMQVADTVNNTDSTSGILKPMPQVANDSAKTNKNGLLPSSIRKIGNFFRRPKKK